MFEGSGTGLGASTAPRPIQTFAFHIQTWKHDIFRRYFPDRDFTFVPMYLDEAEFRNRWTSVILQAKKPEIFVWSLRAPEGLADFAASHDIPVFFIEDGFIRSLEASAGRSAPLSLTIDSNTAYFDCRTPSGLEQLLSSYAFDDDPELLDRAAGGIRFLLETGVSKYNGSPDIGIDAIYGPKLKRRVLVLGQVEDDASIAFGCDRTVTNNDLVRLAASENPDAQIIYKPHPDILNRVRLAQSDPADVRHLCQILDKPMSMATSFKTIDHVYTITSLAGFEALLRGLKVTVYGCPFYAGWGLTDDRQPNPRRGRQLSLAAVFAGAYLLYPRYFDPKTGQAASFEETVQRIRRHLDSGSAIADQPVSPPAAPSWRPWGAYGLLGWRHLLTPFVAAIVARIGHPRDAQVYREDPVRFFREMPNRKFRFIGKLLYPFD
ncbi:capsular polysaccharide export protein, LipB/KpsS family [Pararhizobium gei]|uniref:capsular polysaccharide export protein, LipB/KpsS family n=1 Tax=Pararhizobium gei TaxID=1395951 RepID=UPI0023DC2073|nr:capsular polysaccharide biosynthesis protein [Rhizobium gei]